MRVIGFVAAALLAGELAAAVTVDLDGAWRLQAFPQPDDGAVRTLPLPKGLDVKAYPATVPGCCEMELVKAGELPDPRVGRNVAAFQAYEGHQWLYSRTFRAPTGREPGGRQVFVFEGIDTLADVFLNGERIGEAANMLIPHEFDVTGKVRDGETNEVSVLIRPVGLAAAEMTVGELGRTMVGGSDHLCFRKAPYMYGWDFFPRLPVSGLWRSVRFEQRDAIRIDQPAWIVRTLDVAQKRAQMFVTGRIAAPFRHFHKTKVRFSLSFDGKVCAVCTEDYQGPQVRASFDVPDVRLWWPKGAGDQPLYDARIELVDAAGRTLAENVRRIGIRTVDLEYADAHLPDDAGKYLLKINGEPIFIRGVNWAPLDAIPSRQAEKLRETLPLLGELGCNFVRVWGGGVYEPDAFFDWCDANGVMVLQDFMMSCATPPQDDAFAAAFRAEALSVVLRLRNHPSLVAWAGDNESDCTAFEAFMSLPHKGRPSDNRVSREVIPSVLHEYDVTRPYRPSCQFISDEVYASRAQVARHTENHLWADCSRDWWKCDYLTNSVVWFASEAGSYAFPPLETVRFMLGEDAARPWENPDAKSWRELRWADAWERRGYNPHAPMSWLFGRTFFGIRPAVACFGDVPRHDVAKLIAHSQAAQAESLKFQIEFFRSGKFRNRSGYAVWKFREGWPCFSESLVDALGRKLPSFETVKAAYREVLAIVAEDGRLLVVNDTLAPVSGTLRVTEASDGRTVWEGPYAVGANGLAEVTRIAWSGQGLFRVDYTVNGEGFRTHYLHGEPPFAWNDYSAWIDKVK